jgi:hypothetical protein
MLPVPLPVEEWIDPRYGQGTGHPLLDESLDLTTPIYTATAGVEADYVEGGDDLTALLGELADVATDLAVWKDDGTLAAIVRGGVATVFETAPPDGYVRPDKRKPAPQLFGRTVTAILIWMGKRGWSFSEAHGVLLRLRVQIA